MAKIKIDNKIIEVGAMFNLVESKINKIDSCSTVEELNALLADIKIGIDCFSKAVIVDGVCRSAIQVLIDSLKSELTDATKKVEKKLNSLLTAEARVDIGQLLILAKKWLSYGHKDIAHSYLRTYRSLADRFKIDKDSAYEQLLAKC